MTPERRWLVAIYGSLFVPFVGAMLLAIGSSVAYWRLRRSRPELARWVNLHSWIAILINAAANLAIVALMRRH